ncbi:hypothetical protein C8F04DRAFT_1024417, partial [Mycena alexandri]
MYHSRLPSAAQDFHFDRGSATTSRNCDGSTETLLPLAARSEEVPKKSGWMLFSNSLGFVSLLLHLGLIIVHLALVGIWAKRLEYRIVFPLEHQTIISFAVTAATTSFGMGYSALLVFVTQKLSMRRSLTRRQTLTETHDIASAWGGIGAAILSIWQQRKVTSSIAAVLSVFFYLGCILVLHVTTPALFSVETFNATRFIQVGTQGLPAYDWPDELSHRDSDVDSLLDHILATLSDYAMGSLEFFPCVVDSVVAPGLSGGTLYDAPDLGTLSGMGDVTVNATGFNISCGYLDNTLDFAIGPDTPRGVIVSPLSFFDESLLVYSTIPITDSNNKSGPSTQLVPPSSSSVSSVYWLRCSQTLINQKAVVDVQSQNVVMLSPNIEKTHSLWAPFSGPYDKPVDTPRVFMNSSDGNLFLDIWAKWYSWLGSEDDANDVPYGTADLYLIQKLNLFPIDGGPPRENVTLHELENAFSIIVASMFWTLGHQPPAAPRSVNLSHANGSLVHYSDSDLISPGPFLLNGTVDVATRFPQGRLSSSLIAISIGLFASFCLMLLSLHYYP